MLHKMTLPLLLFSLFLFGCSQDSPQSQPAVSKGENQSGAAESPENPASAQSNDSAGAQNNDPASAQNNERPARNTQMPQIQQVNLDAEQLADILQIQTWTFRYSGGPVRCWLEFEESGQKTMPTRIPRQGFIGDKFKPQKNEGKILLWYRKDSLSAPRSGGTLELKVGPDFYSLGIPADGFIFGWKVSGATGYIRGVEPITAKAGKELTLMSLTFKALETPAEEAFKPRSVKLTLKAMFPDPAD